MKQPESNLGRTIGRRCRGRTLILGRELPALMNRLEAQRIEAVTRRLDDSGSDPSTRFQTVVLFGAVEYQDRSGTAELLRRAWQLVAPRGKLLVCVPNDGHAADPDVRQRFTRRGLKELLKTIDQPKIFTDQPYGWLLMALDADTRLDRPAEDRHQVVAALCQGEVLELGCAAGHLCAAIAQRGLSVAGIDKNQAKIDKARRLFPDIEFTQADILRYPVERGYDTVILAEVLEHVPVDVGDGMLAKAWELVSPGGRLIVGVPNEDCVRHANHLREFTEADLAEILSRFGSPTVVTDQPFRWLLMYVDRDRRP